MSVKTVLFVVICIFSDIVSGTTLAERRENLEQVAVYDRFRIFYSLSGEDALPPARRADDDNDGIPEYVDQLGRRFLQTDRFYRNEVGLVSPLDGERYKGHAHYIDVNLLNIPRNGIAYDGTPKLDRSISHQKSVPVLLIDLSNSLNWGNKTPEHELFHIYQNGYTYFKNRWYTEGTARWSENIQSGRVGKGGFLPASRGQREALFEKTYDASQFWNELILRADNGTHGKTFIRHLLETLREMDEVAARERGINRANWPEAEQRSEKNNPYIWRAIQKTLKDMGYSSTEDGEIKTLFGL